MHNADKSSYKIGLCLAGAATGGAFSAGVMDFFLEALAEWQKAKDTGVPGTPQWSVDLREMIGTSAGGITCALAAASLNSGCEPLPNNYKLGDPAPKHNPLFATWVKEMDHSRLLVGNDLEKRRLSDEIVVVSSILNRDFMADTARKVLADHGDLGPLPAYAPECVVTLTATSLRGVPYHVPGFVNTVDTVDDFEMRRFADWTPFTLTDRPRALPPALKDATIPVDAQGARSRGAWARIVTCARATAAFPGGFPTVGMSTPRALYEKRLAQGPSWVGVSAPGVPGNTASRELPDDEVEYAAVDGGCVNNEPFDVLAQQIERREGRKLARRGADSWGSIILIDPFPEGAADNMAVSDNMPLAKAIAATISSIRGQAMFKRDAVEGHFDVNDMSKFLLRPERVVKPGQEYKLATNTLGSFGGMLDEQIRLHDFQLGRRNCQQFLRVALNMSVDEMRQNEAFAEFVSPDATGDIAIIPLVGTAAQDCPMPQWPVYDAETADEIGATVLAEAEQRAKDILEVYFHNMGLYKWPRINPVNYIVGTVRDMMAGFIAGKVDSSIKEAMSHFT